MIYTIDCNKKGLPKSTTRRRHVLVTWISRPLSKLGKKENVCSEVSSFLRNHFYSVSFPSQGLRPWCFSIPRPEEGPSEPTQPCNSSLEFSSNSTSEISIEPFQKFLDNLPWILFLNFHFQFVWLWGEKLPQIKNRTSLKIPPWGDEEEMLTVVARRCKDAKMLES